MLRVRTFVASMWLLSPLLAQTPTPAEAEDILTRMARTEEWRTQTLREYAVMRRYVLTGSRFRQPAEMGVRALYSYPGRKELHVVWRNGSPMLQKRVLGKVLEAELEAARDDVREGVRVTAQNYDFRVLGVELLESRRCYVIELKPKRRNKFLVDGRIWVDAEDAAIVRLEGSPAAAHSFWIRNLRMVQTYRKVGPFWLLASYQTDSDVRLFGSARLIIDYGEYEVSHPLLARGAGVRRPVR